MIAALVSLRPELSLSGSLYRSLRVLKGWRKLTPTMSKTPFPLAAWAALCLQLVRKGYKRLAIMIFVSVAAYLRIVEMLSVTFGAFQPPSHQGVKTWSLHLFPQVEDRTSKTGQTDESVALDASYVKQLAPIFAEFKKMPAAEKVVNMNYPEYLALFRETAAELGLKGMLPSMPRHSGASIDRANNERSPDEVRKHGRWMVVRSVARYEKKNRLNKVWHSFSAEQRNHFEEALRSIGRGLMYGQVPAPLSRPKVGDQHAGSPQASRPGAPRRIASAASGKGSTRS